MLKRKETITIEEFSRKRATCLSRSLMPLGFPAHSAAHTRKYLFYSTIQLFSPMQSHADQNLDNDVITLQAWRFKLNCLSQTCLSKRFSLSLPSSLTQTLRKEGEKLLWFRFGWWEKIYHDTIIQSIKKSKKLVQERHKLQGTEVSMGAWASYLDMYIWHSIELIECQSG